jgi:endonuclease III
VTSKVKRPKTAAERRARVDQILRGLDEMYPNVTCALHHREPWELLVATILSAQCTDKRVNEVTPGLFAKYPTRATLPPCVRRFWRRIFAVRVSSITRRSPS